ncbi:hypothetical protein QM012_000217 [Aureobasidium pullulans]|uniref:RING-type domain-containing protein n=1 Tax=Aureobasidium pullulans TaxID=5580 RepID=A0ABR0TV01_AURPU
MAPVKRPHDVISIHSDSSEDDWATLARPHKMARLDEVHTAPSYVLDNYLEQYNMPGLVRTVSVKREGDAVPQAQAGALAATPQTINSVDLDLGPPFEFNFNELPFAYEASDSQDDPIIITDTTPTPEPSEFNQVLEVVPDVSHDHIIRLLETHNHNLERVLDVLLDGKYPKESDKRAAEEAARKAALHDQKLAEEAEKEKLLNPQCTFSGKMKDVIIEVLKNEFNTIPIKYIKEIQKDKKHLYPTYLALNEAKHTEPCPYGKTPWRPLRDINFDLLQATKHQKANISVLKEQFESAQKAVVDINLQRRKGITQKIKEEMDAAAKAREEQSALEHAKATGTIVECFACYDEYPPNRVIGCSSADKHSVCFDCMKTYLESEVGQCSFKLICPGGCDDTFNESQLRLVPDTDALIDKLMRLRQENDLRIAGIDDVESCPFCDFKTVCLPINIDFEFHCRFPACNITSCRKCKEKTHIPDSCEENQRKRDKESALSHRHRIEEARSKALIRNCNKCKQAFIKSDGCNKMTCSKCGNLQCYLCGVNVTANYAHFNAPDSECPVFSETITLDAMHEQEVNTAAEAAQAEVLREHPEIDKADLDIRFSDSAPDKDKHMPPVNQPQGVPANQPQPVPDNPIWDNEFEHLLFRGEVARMRRLNRHQPQEAANPPVVRPAPFVWDGHAPILPQAAGADLPAARQRAPADVATAFQAARNRPDPFLANNANAQQLDPADGFLEAGLGRFNLGWNEPQADANLFALDEDYNEGYLQQPDGEWAAENAFYPENRFQGLDDWMMNNRRLPQAQPNMAPPIPDPALGAQNVDNHGINYPSPLDMGYGYAW